MTANRLDELLAVRGRLLPGEVVTVVAGVAAELAHLHAARRAHGALDATAVTIDPAGRPRLHGVRSADVGTNADADVRALARLAGELLGHAPPRSVVDVLRDAEVGRHTATSFAGALLEACRPEPVRVPGARAAEPPRRLVVRPAPVGTQSAWRPRSRALIDAVRERLPRTRVVAAVVAPFLLLGCLLLWAESRSAHTGREAHAARSAHTAVAGSRTPSAMPTPTATRVPARSGWRGRLDGLDRRRALAYARDDPAALRQVYVAGSRVLAADTATLRRYVADGLCVRGMRLEVTGLSVVRHSRRAAVLAVTDRLAGYDVVDARGRLVRHEPGRGPVRWRITLRNVEGRWLIADSRRA